MRGALISGDGMTSEKRGRDGDTGQRGGNVALADSIGLDHMRAFLALVDGGSQVAAARTLRVAQGTISRHVERVQQHFGGGLFEPGAGVLLSTRGRMVEHALRAALDGLSLTRDRLLPSRPVLRIGFIRAVRLIVEEALCGQATRRKRPGFDVRLLEMTTDEQMKALARRDLDIAICYTTGDPAYRDELEETLVADEPIALVVPQAAWVRGKLMHKRLEGLTHARVLERHSPQFARGSSEWIARERVRPGKWVDCDSGGEVLAYAGSGHGFGFLPALWSLTNHQRAVFVPPSGFAPRVRIAAYSLHHVSPWVSQLRDDISELARQALSEFRHNADEIREG